MEQSRRLFDCLSDDQLIKLAQSHLDKFNNQWRIVMSSHYTSGRHIDAQVSMDEEYATLGAIHNYIYDSRPAALWERFNDEINWAA